MDNINVATKIATDAIDASLRTRAIVTLDKNQFVFGILCVESKDRDITADLATFWGIKDEQVWCVKMA